MPRSRPDLSRSLLAGLFIIGLIAASLRVLQPFLVGFLWATMIVVVTWPLMLWLQARLWHRRWLAVAVLVLGLLLLVVAPLTAAITAAVTNADEIATQAKALATIQIPMPPDWVAELPGVGASLAQAWREFAEGGMAAIWARLSPYTGVVTQRALSEVGDAGSNFVQFLLTLLFAALMYLQGEEAAHAMRRIGQRLGGRQGVAAVKLTTQAIRGVALGVGGTAVIQAILTGVALAIAGVPYALMLGVIALVSCIVQIGTPLVLGPAVAWLYWNDAFGRATFLLIAMLVIGTLDNVLRPILIQRGVDLPFVLVFTGVIGGLIAFGLVGIFVGPVVLAVAQMLLREWIADRPVAPAIRPPAP